MASAGIGPPRRTRTARLRSERLLEELSEELCGEAALVLSLFNRAIALEGDEGAHEHILEQLLPARRDFGKKRLQLAATLDLELPPAPLVEELPGAFHMEACRHHEPRKLFLIDGHEVVVRRGSSTASVCLNAHIAHAHVLRSRFDLSVHGSCA